MGRIHTPPPVSNADTASLLPPSSSAFSSPFSLLKKYDADHRNADKQLRGKNKARLLRNAKHHSETRPTITKAADETVCASVVENSNTVAYDHPTAITPLLQRSVYHRKVRGQYSPTGTNANFGTEPNKAHSRYSSKDSRIANCSDETHNVHLLGSTSCNISSYQYEYNNSKNRIVCKDLKNPDNANKQPQYFNNYIYTLCQRTTVKDYIATLFQSRLKAPSTEIALIPRKATSATESTVISPATLNISQDKTIDCLEYEIVTTPSSVRTNENKPVQPHNFVSNAAHHKTSPTLQIEETPSQFLHSSSMTPTHACSQSSSTPSSFNMMSGSDTYTTPINTISTTQPHSHQFQTSSSQKKFLKSIRMYALGIFAVACSTSAIICYFAKNHSLSASSSSTLNVRSNHGHDRSTNEIMTVMYSPENEKSTRTIYGSRSMKLTHGRNDYDNHYQKRRSASGTNSNINNQNKIIPKVKQPRRDIDHDKVIEEVDVGSIHKLRNEFHEWIKDHGRDYGNDEEKEKRFNIWKDNHFRTIEKNEKHGPCKLTGKDVFGSNHFKDLTHDEFRSKYLTGYTGPKTDELGEHRRRKLRTSNEFNIQEFPTSSRKAKPVEMLSSNGLHDPAKLSQKIKRHESVHERYLKHIQDTPKLSKTYYNKQEKETEKACKCGNYVSYNNRRRGLTGLFKRESPMYGKTYYNRSEKNKICGSSYGKTYYNKNYSGSNNRNEECSKYQLQADIDYNEVSNERSSSISCNWYDMTCWLQKIFAPVYSVAHRESLYDNYNYPTSIDWRKIGAVTQVHSQGSCGACWAITATETIEAVNFIATGVLRDLSETEVIICEDSCQMCDGGWPQNAYDYVEENQGLPAESSSSYDGDFLMTLTTVASGESDEMSENEVEYIKANTCPAEGNSGDNSGSSAARYGAIKGYAYATDRCICYTDGSGCDCDEQDEELAVMNVASYGPATVCLEASTWQDYTGGVITTDSGCTSAFLDMNHCVQVVGYAYTDVSDGNNEEEGSGSHDEEGNSYREGYWIVRNQWSSYWGMNGYAYVAMGDNTCGILNDMTQVFMD